jgi:hypothetical protein
VPDQHMPFVQFVWLCDQQVELMHL